MTRRATCPECSTALTPSEGPLGKSLHCPNCRRVFKSAAFRPREVVVAERPTRNGESRRLVAAGDGRDGESSRTRAESHQAADPEDRPRPKRRAGIVAVAALSLLLAAAGGVAYWRAKPAPSPVVVEAEPAHPDAAPAEPAPARPPDPRPPRPIEGRAPQDAEPEAQKRRWEYLVVTLPADTKQATDQMNQFAVDRWEYVGLVNTAVPAVWGYTGGSPANIELRASRDASVLLRRPRIPLKVAGAIEGEGLKVLATSGGFPYQGQDMSGCMTGQWSGDWQLFVKPVHVGAWVDFEIPGPATGTYRVLVYLTRSWDYGILQFLVNGTRVGKPIDTFHATTIVSTGAIDLGEVDLKEGANHLRVEVVGTNRNSSPPHYSWGLDCVVLTRVK